MKLFVEKERHECKNRISSGFYTYEFTSILVAIYSIYSFFYAICYMNIFKTSVENR